MTTSRLNPRTDARRAYERSYLAQPKWRAYRTEWARRQYAREHGKPFEPDPRRQDLQRPTTDRLEAARRRNPELAARYAALAGGSR